LWTSRGYPAFSVVNFNRLDSYRMYAAPVDLPFMRDVATMRRSLAIVGETVLSLAHGIGRFKATETSYWLPDDFGGRVLISGVGKSVVPNYPLKGALVTGRGVRKNGMFSLPGYYHHMLKFTDPYGRYWLPNQASDFICWWQFYVANGYSPVAAGYDDGGRIAYMKDEGEEGQRLYKSVNLPADGKKWRQITLVAFRSTPVTILDLTNPQTMTNYADAQLVSQKGLTLPRKQCVFVDDNMHITFIEPDERFFVELKSGAPGNELAMTTRAFMLGPASNYRLDPRKEIDGPGYLAADTAILGRVPFDVARSMVYVNGRRLELQNAYGMADERTNQYHNKAAALCLEATSPTLSDHERRLIAGQAVTYATLNHPVIRESITEAVLGILWYLGLLAPFVFFFEKLVFGFADIRKQLTAQAAIFVLVFVLLRLLHPAFEMVRSSLMILLGFVIILISGGITVLFGAKFQENLEQMRRRRGVVTAAEVNRGGVIGSAFMLGLNNMHRRKMRTGLTCAVLVLMTFVMICFSSVQNNLVDETVALGKAPYQGLLIKNEGFREVRALSNIREQYGDRFAISPRKMLFGSQDWQERRANNPELEIVYTAGARPTRADFSSIVQLSAHEPLRNRIKLLTRPRWFAPEDEADVDPLPVMIPDRMAQGLGLTPEAVDAAGAPGVPVSINGRTAQVIGIYDSKAYAALRDIDGTDLLPYDIEAMTNVVTESGLRGAGGGVVVSDDDPHIPADRVILAPFREDLRIQARYASGVGQVVSVVVDMSGIRYREARELIDSYLERKAEKVFYGLGGVAYSGKRAREMTLAGLIELLIPLMIAGLTVVNTMRGSVYERRDEIFVYNAVGIAPIYVFFMFFAEAFVYAVVGSVLGYILSQGTGRILTELALTGGMNMSFTSITTILASILISLSVFVSTLFPALTAMRIAAPAEESGWRLPETQGDELAFRLPFTFNCHDRVAVLAFFDRYLKDHGEGSAGRFFAGPPSVGVAEYTDPLAPGAYIPELSVTVWLKPFDLAVSQRMTLRMPCDAETREFIAEITLTRLSGTREAWMRLNKGFVALMRRHFLHWRAVGPAQRAEMFDEARNLMLAASQAF